MTLIWIRQWKRSETKTFKPMARKVYVDVKVRLILNLDDNIEVAEVIQEMDYRFNSTDDRFTVEDEEIVDYEVTDSK